MTHSKNIKIRGIVFFAAIISCFAAFINKYPLVYPDTGTYIYSGFSGIVFNDRPIFYGLFLRHVSLAASLWFVIFAQAILICYLVYLTLEMFFEGLKKDIIYISIITFLTLFTGYSYTVSILIPDIFSSITILCLVNLYLNKSLTRLKRIGISILMMFSVCTQFSSLAIMLLFFAAFSIYLVFKKIKKETIELSLKKIIILFSLVFSCALIIPTVHFAFNKEFKISGSTHVFLMNHLIETGILDDYLEENCSNHNFKLCGYRDQLGWNFIWSADSPLQKTGGWTANKSEYSFIIKEILTTPKYLILLFHKSIEYTLKQFFTFNVSISGPQLKPSPPYDQISWRFEDTKMEYLSSLQNQSKLNVDFVNILEQIFVMLSIVFLIVTLITPTLSDKLEHNLKWTIILIMIYDFLNSFVCANLSTVDERFQNRLIWLFPMLAIIVMMKFVEKKVKIVL